MQSDSDDSEADEEMDLESIMKKAKTQAEGAGKPTQGILKKQSPPQQQQQSKKGREPEGGEGKKKRNRKRNKKGK